MNESGNIFWRYYDDQMQQQQLTFDTEDSHVSLSKALLIQPLAALPGCLLLL